MLKSEKYFKQLNNLAKQLEKEYKKGEITLKEYSTIRKGISKLVFKVEKSFKLNKKISDERAQIEFYTRQKFSEINVDFYKPSHLKLFGKKLKNIQLKDKDKKILKFQQHFVRAYKQRFELLKYQDKKWGELEDKFFKSLNYRKIYNDFKKGLLDFNDVIGTGPFSFKGAGIDTENVAVLRYLEKNENLKKKFGIMLETSEMSVNEMQDISNRMFNSRIKNIETDEVLKNILKSL